MCRLCEQSLLISANIWVDVSGAVYLFYTVIASRCDHPVIGTRKGRPCICDANLLSVYLSLTGSVMVIKQMWDKLLHYESLCPWSDEFCMHLLLLPQWGGSQNISTLGEAIPCGNSGICSVILMQWAHLLTIWLLSCYSFSRLKRKR